MHQVYNMGHRLEVFLEPKDAEVALQLAAELGLSAQVIGRTEPSTRPDGANHVTVIKDGQVLAYA
jgi:phosphoribosylformylglycinamidine cyclo-ligase